MSEKIKGKGTIVGIQHQPAALEISNFKLQASPASLSQHASHSTILKDLSSRHIFILQSTDINYLTVARRTFSDWLPRPPARRPRTLEAPQAQ